MTNIDDEVRALLATAAENVTPESVPPLRLPEIRARQRFRREPGRGARTWLAPVAAAAAVVVIAVAATVVASLPHARRQPLAVAGRLPAYYLAMTGHGSVHLAGIYATATGRLIAPVHAAGSANDVLGVSAAVDDRTFVFAAEGDFYGVRFYLAKFNPATLSVRVSTLRAPRLPNADDLEALALSPNGSKLAVAFMRNTTAPAPGNVLSVFDLSGGPSRSWTSALGTFASYPQPGILSWAGDNNTLAFTWYAGWESDTSLPLLPGSGVRLLKVTSPAGSPVARSRLVVPFVDTKLGVRTAAGYFTGTLLTLDGKTIVQGVVRSAGHRAAFAKFSATDGALKRLIDGGPYKVVRRGGPIWVMWASPDGETLIVDGPPGHPGHLGVLRGTRLTFLPRAHELYFPYAAW